jgi:hypothetical protein
LPNTEVQRAERSTQSLLGQKEGRHFVEKKNAQPCAMESTQSLLGAEMSIDAAAEESGQFDSH